MRCPLSRSNAHADRLARLAWLPAMALISFAAFPGWTQAAEPEREQLQLLVRQIDLMERTARHAASLPRSTDTRYRFNYPRLLDDIARVRGGVLDYLTPQRAQPRDAAELHGDYARQSSSRNDPTCR